MTAKRKGGAKASRGRVQRAIQLRLVVRRALKVNDMKAVCEWNTRADKAVADLDPFEMGAYMAWAFGSLTKKQKTEHRRMVGELRSLR